MRIRRVTRVATVVAITVLAFSLVACTSIGRGRAQVITRAVAAPPNSAPPSHPVVTAFQPSWNDPGFINDSRTAISTVAISGIDIAADGRSVTAPTSDVLKQVTRAHSLGLKAEVLLLNYQAGVGFSDQVAATMLGTVDTREAAAASLADVVKSAGFDGVMFDLESLSSSEAPALTAFAATLREKVGQEIHLDAAIQAATTPAGYARLGYDIPGLLTSLNNVTVMAYDEHGTFDASDPGPVGSLPWTQRVLDALLHLAKPGQVDLGVPGYGYRWASDGVHTVGDHRARRLVAAAGATADFDEREGEWTVTLSDGQVFWWQDARSIALREQLAASLGLHGVAVWSLAVSDPIPAVP